MQWVVDGYTSTANYPDSQRINLHQATSNSLTNATGIASQPNTQVNYLHNSVKAVVDAYTGKVTLYSWNQANQPDPVLQTWESAFPGLVQPESSIPSALLPLLRYPQDLFDVQRLLLTQYHVTDPSDFYNGSDFWKVPNDPTVAAANTLNGAGFHGSTPTMPSTYMSLSHRRRPGAVGAVDADGDPQLPRARGLPDRERPARARLREVHAAGLPRRAVRRVARADPERHRVRQHHRPGADPATWRQLQGGARQPAHHPLDNKVLYVEPVYAQARGANSFPNLRHVIAVYGDGQPAFKSTLNAALRQAIANDAQRH